MHSQCHLTRFAIVLAAATTSSALMPATVWSQEPRADTNISLRPQEPRTDTNKSISFVRPALDLTWTSGAPDARGDGAAMSGVGLDLLLGAGARGALGPVRFSFVPELVVNQNRDHQTFASGDPARNAFASPFYFGAYSADLPSRPGDGTRVQAALGESGVWWTGQRAFVGVLANTPQWGPGDRPPGMRDDDAAGDRSPGEEMRDDHAAGEGLVFGRSAPGVPRVEAAVAWRPDAGVVRLRWFTGIVRESDWFDDDPDNDSRIVSGARVEFDRDDWLKLGVARTVMSASGRGTLAAAVQPFARTGSEPIIELVSADLLFTARDAGTAAWLELARQEPIEGVRAFLRFPTRGIAFRGGLTQRLRRTASAEWSASVAFARLDQSGASSDELPTDFYTSPTVIHGWTHRGQPLGSGLGPGGQRQFASLDRAGRTWRLGAFVERVRRNEDAMYRQGPSIGEWHDVTLQAGLVAARRMAGYDVEARLSAGKRLNYLFQGAGSAAGNEPVDLSVLRLGVSFRPVGAARRIVGVLPRS